MKASRSEFLQPCFPVILKILLTSMNEKLGQLGVAHAYQQCHNAKNRSPHWNPKTDRPLSSATQRGALATQIEIQDECSSAGPLQYGSSRE